MRNFRAAGLGLIGAGLMVAVSGCGEAGGRPAVSTSTTKAKVSGLVRYKGKPATKGTVTFDPSNVERKGAPVAIAPIGKDGRYSLETFTGQNMVVVTIPRTPPSARPRQVNIVEGENSIDVEIPPS